MLRKQSKAAQVQHLIAVFVYELQNLLHETLRALVLDVSLGGSKQGAHRVYIDATLDESSTGFAQLLQTVIIGGIHDSKQCARLERDASGVDVLDELTEHIWFEFLDNQGLVLLTSRLNWWEQEEKVLIIYRFS